MIMPNTSARPPVHALPLPPDELRVSTHLYMAAGMALLIGMLVASYMQASAGLEALKQFGVANQRADHLDRLSQLLLHAQAATRGYALTRSPTQLESYRATVPLIQDILRVIERDHVTESRSDISRLVRLAHGVAARQEITTRHLEQGMAPKKSWFEEGSLAMEAYQRQHNKMKVDLLTTNLQNVRKSVSGFEMARVSTVLLAIASLLLLLLTISQQQKKQELQAKIRHLLEAENERLDHEVRLRTAELTNLATYLTDVRETEKLHLARELHDELGALLTAAKLDADWIERKLPPETRALVEQRLTRLRQSLTGGITLKRRITNNLRPALLYDLGLIEALKSLVAEFREDGEAEITVDLPEDCPELSEDVSLSLFRIVQEALTNVRKYAQARHVHVALRMQGTSVELSIEDDGIGFDPHSPQVARHGLAGIKHRVFTHGGQLDIRTAPGKGVAIQVALPL